MRVTSAMEIRFKRQTFFLLFTSSTVLTTGMDEKKKRESVKRVMLEYQIVLISD